MVDTTVAHFPRLSTDKWNGVNSYISQEEIKVALFDMAPFKAP